MWVDVVLPIMLSSTMIMALNARGRHGTILRGCCRLSRCIYLCFFRRSEGRGRKEWSSFQAGQESEPHRLRGVETGACTTSRRVRRLLFQGEQVEIVRPAGGAGRRCDRRGFGELFQRQYWNDSGMRQLRHTMRLLLALNGSGSSTAKEGCYD